MEGTLSVQPQANPVKGFQEYFLNLTVENNKRNPWFGGELIRFTRRCMIMIMRVSIVILDFGLGLCLCQVSVSMCVCVRVCLV